MAFLAALFVAVGVVAVAWGFAERIRERQRMLAEILEAELQDPSTPPGSLAEMFERAGGFAERALGHTSWPERVRRALTRAGWTLRAGEFVAVCVASAAGVGFLTSLVTGSMWRGFVLGVLTPFVIFTVVKTRGERRIRKVEEQLPTVLTLLASSLESGASVLHAMELVSAEGDPPLADEFARVVAETKVGRPLVESLEAMATRVGSRDLEWTVEAIRIQHRTGGKLADTLRVLADFMRTRIEVRGEVRALSAEARLSGKILTGLPFVLGGWLFVASPGYLEPLFTTDLGRMMIVFGLVGITVGIVWMRRIVRVEV